MITINGKTYQGNNISIINGVVSIDGEVVDKELPENILKIKIEGSVGNIVTDKSVECNNVEGDVIAGGSVACTYIANNVEAIGSVNCEDVGGSVTAGGSINCSYISADAKAGGSINANKIVGMAFDNQPAYKNLYDRKPKSETILGKIAKAFRSRIR